MGGEPFEVIFLSDEETSMLDKYTQETKNFFEVSIKMPGLKKESLWLKVSQNHVSILRYYLKLIPRTVFRGKLHPNFRIDLCKVDHTKFTLSSSQIEIFSPFRNVIAALILHFSTKKKDSATTFVDLRKSFQTKLQSLYSKDNLGFENHIGVKRENLVTSAMAEIGRLSLENQRRFRYVHFIDEPAIDQGGPRREFYTILCKELFGESQGLFAKLDPSSSCIHPVASKKLSSHLKLYRFAGYILGKIIYDTYVKNLPLHVNVYLSQSTRKFLVQMACDKEDFEVDDPEFFRGMVQRIQTSDMDLSEDELGFSLTFSEEEHEEGKPMREVELNAGGKRIRVTEANKADYLQLLAEYKLIKRVEPQLREFAEGFYEIIPDDLICMFDHKELELLICGMPEINLEELKRHVEIQGAGTELTHWFWTALENLSQEQLAKLLQFVTGSSQVPLGGFASYSPKLKFAFLSDNASLLPTASTCANLMKLSKYTSFEQLQQKILQAINESVEGFGNA